jgi:hypothetical protein
MAHIVLTEEQMRQLNQSPERIEVRDPRNNPIGYLQLQISDFTPEEIEEARRRLASDQPRYTTAQVLAYLRSLEKK